MIWRRVICTVGSEGEGGGYCFCHLQLFRSRPSPNITQHFDLALLECWLGGGGSLIASLMRGYGGMGVWVVMREARFIFYFDDENSWLYSLCIARCVIAGGEQDLGWQLWRGWMWALHTSCSYSTVLVYDLSLLSKSVCPYTCSYVYHHHHHHHHHLRGSSHSAAHLGPRCRLFWFWNIIVGYCRFLFKLRSDLSIFSMDFLDLFYLLDLKRIFRIR